jgi:hypothetical protein
VGCCLKWRSRCPWARDAVKGSVETVAGVEAPGRLAMGIAVAGSAHTAPCSVPALPPVHAEAVHKGPSPHLHRSITGAIAPSQGSSTLSPHAYAAAEAWPPAETPPNRPLPGTMAVNEIVIFPRAIGPWVPRASRFRAVGAATPNALGCLCSSARPSRPRAGWSWSATPGLTAPAKGRQRLFRLQHLGPRRIQTHVITHLQPACQPVF